MDEQDKFQQFLEGLFTNREQGRVLPGRVFWALKAAHAHAQGVMPWAKDPPTREDAAWVRALSHAVREQQARPEHPDPDLEHWLIEAFGEQRIELDVDARVPSLVQADRPAGRS
jgi:hypothetical protein